jgi:maltooligosyltrehalose trehalohydrolase
MLGERTSQLVSFEMQKLLAGAVMVSPFLPLLFMGEEWSEPNPFQYFVSHTDPNLAEAIRIGRKKEFAAFNTTGKPPDPMSLDTFNHSKLQWPLLDVEPHKTMFRYYKYLIYLRKQHPVLKELNRKNILVASDQESKIIKLKRWDENLFAFVVMNFSNQIQKIDLPNEMHENAIILNSAHQQWGGTISIENPQGQSIIEPESIIIFSNYHV